MGEPVVDEPRGVVDVVALAGNVDACSKSKNIVLSEILLMS